MHMNIDLIPERRKVYRVSDARIAAYLLYKGCQLKKHWIEDINEMRVTFLFEDGIDREDLQRSFYNRTPEKDFCTIQFCSMQTDIKNLIVEAKRNARQQAQDENKNAEEKKNEDNT